MSVNTIRLPLPRPITSIHQIEMTSHCNLRCVYCVSPNLKREKQHMEERVFRRALEWAQHFRQLDEGRVPQQTEINLAGIGESTIHPQFVDFVRIAREAFPASSGVRLVLATNGVAWTEELAAAVAPYELQCHVSLHRPEKAGRAIEILKKHNMLYAVSADPSIAAIDWAGQVDWHRSAAPDRECNWLRRGWGFVMADGRIGTCSLDSSAAGAIGHVDQEIGTAYVQPYSLCATCDQHVAIEGYAQWPKEDKKGLPIVSA